MPLWICSFILLPLCLLPSVSSGHSLNIPGTGACEKVLGQIARAYNQRPPDTQVIVPPSTGSDGGINAIRSRKAILARVARPLNAQERDAQLKYLAFARDAILFVTGESVGNLELNDHQLSAIFAGKIKTWDDFTPTSGQHNSPIRVLVREESDSSLQVIKHQVQGFTQQQFSSHSKTVYHDHEMLAMLQKYPTAIGWLTGSSLIGNKKQLGIVQLNGVAPTASNIRKGAYPLIAEYALVYKDQALPSVLQDFIDFIFSAQGAEILQKFGLTPLRAR